MVAVESSVSIQNITLVIRANKGDNKYGKVGNNEAVPAARDQCMSTPPCVDCSCLCMMCLALV